MTFEFIRKKPEHLPELIHKIREVLTFDWTDERFGFERQNILFQILIEGLAKKDVLYSTAFYELSKTFLAFKYQQTKSERHYAISFISIPFPITNGLGYFERIFGIM